MIEFEIDNAKLISINEQYMHPVRKTKRGRYVSYFAPTPYLKEVKSFYEEMLKDEISDSDIKKIRDIVDDDRYKGVDVKIYIGMPESHILTDDVTNYVKSLEDCIVKRTSVDDSRHYRVMSEKLVYESDDSRWVVRVRMTVMDLRKYNEIVWSDREVSRRMEDE